MSRYKVPQDVEAEDKLLGPFSFRQFVYLMIAAGAAAAGFFMARVSPFLVLIPLPIFIVFGVLALPLRKDQPMETYLAALIRFYLKPNKRFWQPDGTASLIEITNPKIDEGPQLKDFSREEAATRLSFLSQVVDTQGWSTRGVAGPGTGTSMQDDIFNDAMSAPDILDTTGTVSQAIDYRISQSDQAYRQQIMQNLQQTISGVPAQDYTQPVSQPTTTQQTSDDQSTPPSVHYNPYPDAMQQSVVQPIGQQQPSQPTQPISQPAAPPAKTATESPSPDIIRLATNDDWSVAAIAREAERIYDQNGSGEEVEIKLR